jgi:hypothetical protein
MAPLPGALLLLLLLLLLVLRLWHLVAPVTGRGA